MSEELTGTNWPNPDRPGYYWLKCKTEAQSELEVFYWNKGAEVFSEIGDVGCVDDVCFAQHWEYHGPVKTPDQISEMLAGERERCARLCEEAYETTGRDFEYLGCLSCAEDIRNLGDAP